MSTIQQQSAVTAVSEPKELGFLEMLRRLPSSVRDHLLSEKSKTLRGKIFDRAKLNDEERKIVMDSEIDVYFGQYPALFFPSFLFTALGWPEEREEEAADLAASIMGFLMLPAARFLGPVDQAIDAMGYDHKKFPQEKIKFRVLTFASAVTEILDTCGVEMDTVVRQRVSRILDSYVREVRTLSGLNAALNKPQKVGGPGLSEDDAIKVVSTAEALGSEAVFAEETREIPIAEHGPEETHGTPVAGSVRVWDKAAITEAYSGTAAEQVAMTTARATLRADGDKDVLTRFAAEVVAEDKESSDAMTVVAGTLMLAEAGVLLKTVKEPLLRAAFRTYLEDVGASESIGQLDQDPENTALFAHYLSFLLKVKARLSENDAARFALKALNAMKKAGVKDLTLNVAFHPETGEFVWEFAG